MSYLSKVVQLCEDRHIKLLVVDLPLTDINRSLMPANFYSMYRSKVGSICNNNNKQSRLLELGDSPLFTLSDFDDTIHLNGAGATKLMAQLQGFVQQN